MMKIQQIYKFNYKIKAINNNFKKICNYKYKKNKVKKIQKQMQKNLNQVIKIE
jgi:hypothetical protein